MKMSPHGSVRTQTTIKAKKHIKMLLRDTKTSHHYHLLEKCCLLTIYVTDCTEHNYVD